MCDTVAVRTTCEEGDVGEAAGVCCAVPCSCSTGEWRVWLEWGV